ncbi:MAG: hypothetical protein RBR82_17070, partial [Pseudomonas sp.]|nr:hypothetical protein [Pseudomonas sp.]
MSVIAMAVSGLKWLLVTADGHKLIGSNSSDTGMSAISKAADDLLVAGCTIAIAITSLPDFQC